VLSVLFQVAYEFWDDGLVLLDVKERSSYAFPASSASPTNPVHVVNKSSGRLVVHHERYIFDVNTSSSDIGADKDVAVT
jgi:hypothetical protein